MTDVEITFEREGLTGIVAVDTFLMDAAKRLGVKFDEDCDRAKRNHHCSVTVPVGEFNLSPLTLTESEHFAENGRRASERLACEARIITPGEITIMTDEKTVDTSSSESTKDTFQEEFQALPLDKKFARLVKMEAITLGETLSFVFNSPFTVLEKVGDLMAEFGMKIETEARKASRPAEPEAATAADTDTDTEPTSDQTEPDADTYAEPNPEPAPETYAEPYQEPNGEPDEEQHVPGA